MYQVIPLSAHALQTFNEEFRKFFKYKCQNLLKIINQLNQIE